MAWEWVAPVSTGVVGVAGIASTWSIGLRDRKARAEERKEQRRAEVYIDLLVRVSHDIIDAIPLVGSLAGPVPERQKPEEEILLQARLAAFGSRGVSDTYAQMLEEISNLRHLKNIANGRRGKIHVTESEATKSLSLDEIYQLKRKKWDEVLGLRDMLTNQIRRELGELPVPT
ncbi:hypothetical protein [Micromonospora sp. NPDC051006]|uniref:hypothetical protein n=1 Tax=Micromonospora sp. NPDC051006 TaxID=3364283 RepID=UPI00379AE7D4